MKNSKLITVLAVLGLLAANASAINGPPPAPLKTSFKLTVQAQDFDQQQVGSSTVYKSTILKVKVTNKEILKLLETAYTNNFTGDTLVADYVWHEFVIVDHVTGNVVAYPSDNGFLSFTDDNESDWVTKGSDNTGTDPDSYNHTHVLTNAILFNDPAHTNSFGISGLEQLADSYNGKNYKYSVSSTLTGSGTGTLLTPPADSGSDGVDFFVVSGTISIKGSGVDQ
jgi:hypothetical protein